MPTSPDAAAVSCVQASPATTWQMRPCAPLLAVGDRNPPPGRARQPRAPALAAPANVVGAGQPSPFVLLHADPPRPRSISACSLQAARAKSKRGMGGSDILTAPGSDACAAPCSQAATRSSLSSNCTLSAALKQESKRRIAGRPLLTHPQRRSYRPTSRSRSAGSAGASQGTRAGVSVGSTQCPHVKERILRAISPHVARAPVLTTPDPSHPWGIRVCWVPPWS